jgi:hypothetical protein
MEVTGNESAWFWTMMQFWVYLFTLIAIIVQVRKQNMQIGIQNSQLELQNSQLALQTNQLVDQSNINVVIILNSLNEQWWSTRMRRARKKVCENYKSTSINVEEEAVLSFFENMALYTNRNMINPEFIWETYSYYIERYWLVLKDNVESFQKNDPTYFDGVVRLKNKMHEISLSKNATVSVISTDELTAFVESEKQCYTPKIN